MRPLPQLLPTLGLLGITSCAAPEEPEPRFEEKIAEHCSDTPWILGINSADSQDNSDLEPIIKSGFTTPHYYQSSAAYLNAYDGLPQNLENYKFSVDLDTLRIVYCDFTSVHEEYVHGMHSVIDGRSVIFLPKRMVDEHIDCQLSKARFESNECLNPPECTEWRSVPKACIDDTATCNENQCVMSHEFIHAGQKVDAERFNPELPAWLAEYDATHLAGCEQTPKDLYYIFIAWGNFILYHLEQIGVENPEKALTTMMRQEGGFSYTWFAALLEQSPLSENAIQKIAESLSNAYITEDLWYVTEELMENNEDKIYLEQTLNLEFEDVDYMTTYHSKTLDYADSRTRRTPERIRTQKIAKEKKELEDRQEEEYKKKKPWIIAGLLAALGATVVISRRVRFFP